MSTPTITFTVDELSYALGGLYEKYDETIRQIASTERMLAGGPCCDVSRPRHEAQREIHAALIRQKGILESAIAKARAAMPVQEGTG